MKLKKLNKIILRGELDYIRKKIVEFINYYPDHYNEFEEKDLKLWCNFKVNDLENLSDIEDLEMIIYILKMEEEYPKKKIIQKIENYTSRKRKTTL